jgi:DNA-binding SARP family transcriptional activator/pimeloyl-ACP methyl ester carboxylesterase
MARLDIQLFGFPSARLDGRAVELSLRKGLAVLAYVADTRGPVGRDHLATVLWPEADTEAARGRLRRTLHKIRVAFAADVIGADRTSLWLAPGLEPGVDTHAFAAACAVGKLDAAVELYGADFLDGLSVEGCPAFEEWAYFRREALRSQLAQALERLIEAKLTGGDPRAAVSHASRLVAIDPLSESAHRHLIRAHLAAGDRSAAERQLEACSRLLREELEVRPDPATLAVLEEFRSDSVLGTPRTRYAQVDGIHLAFQTVGNGPVDIVLVPGFVSHVERVWEDSRCRSWLSAASRLGRLILFDRRGVGLSDRVGARPTVEATAQDILAVMDTAGSRRAVLVGSSEGGPGCVRFAVDHPDRLAGLVLWGSLAKGSHAPDHPYALTAGQYDLWQQRLIAQWGGPAEMETFAPSLVGNRQAEAWWAGLLRTASSPGAVRGVLEALRDTDVRQLLAGVTTPTLVLHRTGDRAVRVDAGRFLAAGIRSARFVELPGNDHWFWVGDQEPLIRHIAELVARAC